MTNSESHTDQSKKIIEEYLDAASICIKTSKGDGKILGYPAALLLLCVIDAIGNAYFKENSQKNKSTRLDVLYAEPFKDHLSSLFGETEIDKNKCEKIKSLTHFYRDALCHTGTLPYNIHLDSNMNESAPIFGGSLEIQCINVPMLFKVVKAVWDQEKENFEPTGLTKRPNQPSQPSQPYEYHSSLTSAASGVTSTPQTPKQ